MRKQEKPVLTLDKDKRQMRNYFLAILVFTFLLYGNSIKNDYSLDDNYVTVTNSKALGNGRVAKGIKGIPEIFSTHYVESKEQSFEYRPIPLSTFAIEYQFFGSNPHVSHFISVLIYALTCMLLFSILCRLLKNYNIVFPLLITFLFIAHPIHTEVVDNIKCRDELLSFLFGLCALHFFLKRIETNKWMPVLWTVLFLLMALLCKKTAVLFIVLIPLTVYFFTEIKIKKIVWQGLLLFGVFLIFNLIRRLMLPDLNETRDFAFFENPLYYENDFLKRIPAAFYTAGYYFKLFIFPYPLSCYYGYDTIPIGSWSSPFVIVFTLIYLIMGIYAFAKFSQKNILSYSILVFLVGIFLFSNLITPVAGIVAERLVYFASFGFCVAAAYLLLIVFKVDYKKNSTGLKVLKPSFIRMIIVILFIFTFLTISRNNKWKDELTLFRNDAGHFERSCNLHYLIGTKLYPQIFNTPNGIKKDAIIKEATLHYKQAVQLMMEGIGKYPTDYSTIGNIGVIYVNIFNDAVFAQPYFKKLLAVKPDNLIMQFNLGLCYERRNLPDSAILVYEKTVAAHTTQLSVYLQLHELYLKKQEYLKAIACDEKGIKLMPANAQLYINLGNVLILNKDTENAIIQYKKAVELEPHNSHLSRQVETFLKNRE